jgi:uncharacterized protein (TIGR00304 family)
MRFKMDILILSGIFLIFLGFVLVVVGTFLSATSEQPSVKVAAGGFIGPIPFGFANDRVMFYVLIGIMVFMFVVWFIFRALGR